MSLRRDDLSEYHNGRPRGARLAKRVDEHVGERIRQRRTTLGFTQEQLSAALEISYQQVQKYETGANRVSAGRLFEIAGHLSVDVGYFFDGLDPEARQGPLPHGGRDRVTIELVRNFSSIEGADVRHAVSALVKTLCAEKPEPTPLESMPAMGEAD